MEKSIHLFTNCTIATMSDSQGYGIVEKGALAVSGGKILWTGPAGMIPSEIAGRIRHTTDCMNHMMLPGFVDCHTHLVWGGSRSNEFEMRLNGVSYEQIARNGGGIAATVRATRQASEDRLYEEAQKRVTCLLKQGVTTLEIKSGYGLDMETELKMLRVIDRLDKAFPITVKATFLGAHAPAPEFRDRPRQYIDLVIDEMMPAVKAQGIATAVDAFCENIGFSPADTERVFEAAAALGFDIKLHAEQLSDSGGAALAAGFNARSCDHLEYLNRQGAQAMADNSVTAVLLPGAFYYLKETRKPPVEMLRELKIPMAVSTDLNPGSSPVHSIPLILNMACQMFDLTPAEAIAGATLNGAAALGLRDTKGSLEAGKDADFVLWDIGTPADLCYLAGYTPVKMICVQGRIIIADNCFDN